MTQADSAAQSAPTQNSSAISGGTFRYWQWRILIAAIVGYALDLVDAMVAAADEKVSEQEMKVIERSACPTCGSCSGMFTANSMNCLTEALGLSLPV